MTAEVDELVQADKGLVKRSIFSDEEIFKEEIQQIFTRAWLFVGHESQVPNPNDYVVSRMGTDSVILTRNKQGKIQVLLNSCTHRGMKLCRYDQGNGRTFTCPYHGWSFSTDGELVERPGDLFNVPGHKTHYKGEFDKSQWGLKRVAQVKNYKGTIWATWDKDAPSFEDYIGGMRHYLDSALDHRDGRPGGSVVLGGIQKWRVKCNWKLPAENFVGDLYHDVSHRSVDIVGIGPSGGRGRRDAMGGRVAVAFPQLGHGLLGNLPHYEEPEYSATYASDPELEKYYQDVHNKRVENLGNQMRVRHRVGTIFPNMSFHGWQPRTITVYHPISATEMEMWRLYLVDSDAPKAVKEAARHYFLRYSGPGGMTESDDMENWTGATAACVGAISRDMYFNYEMGIGHTEPIPELPDAVVSNEYTEENARAYYRRWAQFMQAKSWSELMGQDTVAQP